jgi:hypothetical protein
MQKINLETLIQLVEEVDTSDPIDWGMLNIDEAGAIRLVATNLLEQWENEWSLMPEQDRTYTILATITKLVVETFVLNVQLQLKPNNDET